MTIACTSCGADWSTGRFSRRCPECGGGAMERPCILCGGRCGATWKRAVLDSNDAREAHWLGGCNLASGEQAKVVREAIVRTRWWLMDCALPDLTWARLRVYGNGSADVFDSGGSLERFSSEEEARLHLREDEYQEFDRHLIADAAEIDGLDLSNVRPPTGSSDAEIGARMQVQRCRCPGCRDWALDDSRFCPLCEDSAYHVHCSSCGRAVTGASAPSVCSGCAPADG